MELAFKICINAIWLLLLANTFILWVNVYKGHKNLLLLALYMSANFATEFAVQKICAPGVTNHYVYAASIVIHSGFLLAYIFIQPQRNVFRMIPLVSFLYFCYWYFINHMWQTDTLFSIYDFTNYYGIHSINSIVWVFITVKYNADKQESTALPLAVCFLFYHVLGLVNNSLSIVKVITDPIAKKYLLLSPLVVIVIFYSLLVILFKKELSSLKFVSH